MAENSRSLKYSEYEEVGLDDIKLEERKESPMKDVNLVHSEIIEEEFKEVEEAGNEDLKLKLAQIKLPSLTKISEKELEHDIFTILVRPPIVRYVTTLFLATAFVGSIFC